MNNEKKTFNWKPLSEYNGGRVLATNGLDLLIGEITSDGDCADGDGCLLCGITAFVDIDDIIPKPKESEDEKIRKEIIEYIKTGTYHKSWIAWLEKQGKLIEEYEERLDRCACENFNKGYEAAIEHLKEKQGEQPEHGYLKTVYQCGKKPRWNIGDTLAYYEVYSNREGEYVLGKVTKVEFDNDWVYTFENGDTDCEQTLLECATYKKK